MGPLEFEALIISYLAKIVKSLEKFLLFPLNLILRGLQRLHSHYLKWARPYQKVPFPVIVVGSPWIGGAGRTSLVAELIKHAPFSTSEIVCLQYDVYGNASWSDDSKILKELGVKVLLTRNRTVSLTEISTRSSLPKLVICDGGWEDPGLLGYFRVGILPQDPVESISQLWPGGEFRSLSADHRFPDFPVYWKTPDSSSQLNCLSWKPLSPKNHLGEDLKEPCVLILSSGSPHRVVKDLRTRGFHLMKIVALRDHSLKLESKVKFHLSQGHIVLIGHKERVKCSPKLLQNPRLFILQDQISVNWDWQEFWSSVFSYSQQDN